MVEHLTKFTKREVGYYFMALIYLKCLEEIGHGSNGKDWLRQIIL
jgi:hypothetical protein